MSHDGPNVTRRTRPDLLSAPLRECCRLAVRRLRAFTFWLAIGLPWLLLALAAGGYVVSNPTLFAGLVATTVLCALVGRNHRR